MRQAIKLYWHSFLALMGILATGLWVILIGYGLGMLFNAYISVCGGF